MSSRTLLAPERVCGPGGASCGASVNLFVGTYTKLRSAAVHPVTRTRWYSEIFSSVCSVFVAALSSWRVRKVPGGPRKAFGCSRLGDKPGSIPPYRSAHSLPTECAPLLFFRSSGCVVPHQFLSILYSLVSGEEVDSRGSLPFHLLRRLYLLSDSEHSSSPVVFLCRVLSHVCSQGR